MNNFPYLSIVSPVYNAKNIIYDLVKQLQINICKITEEYEIILVNDFSPDDSWIAIKNECKRDTRIKGINLSRNFGQQYAITAGLSIAKGEWIVTIDCDLQDNPTEIINLYNKAQEGYDSVFAKRSNRKDPFLKKLFSKLFYFFFSYLTNTKQDPDVSNFGIFNRKVINAILSMNDSIRYLSTMVQWVGFNIYYLPVIHNDRFEGKSSYNFKKLFSLAFNTIIAFSTKPLKLIVFLGFIISFISFSVGIVFIVRYLFGLITVQGFSTLILSIWFLSGIIIFVLGVIGLYVGKTFENVKNRPVFIVKEIINDNVL